MKPTKVTGPRRKEMALMSNGQLKTQWVYSTDVGMLTTRQIAEAVGKTVPYCSVYLDTDPARVFGPRRKPGPAPGEKRAAYNMNENPRKRMMWSIKKCQCGKYFTPTNGRQKYCENCRQDKALARLNAKMARQLDNLINWR